MTVRSLSCFKTYDVRGRLSDELDTDVAYRIGRAFAELFGAQTVAVGGDARASSPELKNALSQGLMDGGSDVIDLGLTGTEEIYFAGFHLPVDGAIEVTASHNPIDFNGMKFVLRGAIPLSRDNGLSELQALAEAGVFHPSERQGTRTDLDLTAPYIHHVLSLVDLTALRPLKLVVNAGNGAAGHVIDAMEVVFQATGVPVTFVKIQHEPDASFPNGIPNPLLPAGRAATADAVRASGADMGIAWDGDFDRCFLFDETGAFVEGYYIVGLLAAAFLAKNPAARIVHDPRLFWNTADIVHAAGGYPVQSKTGHAFVKQTMRRVNAVYGGEMSAHHYFRDFAYCDSGMIPWLLVAELLSKTGQPLSKLVTDRIQAYPCSGELNYTVQDPPSLFNAVVKEFLSETRQTEMTDGLSLTLNNARLNLRQSNTEPLVRLNVETRSDPALLTTIVARVEALIARTEGHA